LGQTFLGFPSAGDVHHLDGDEVARRSGLDRWRDRHLAPTDLAMHLDRELSVPSGRVSLGHRGHRFVDEVEVRRGQGCTPEAAGEPVRWNAYYVCDGAYGAGRVVRQPSPGMVAALRELAVLDGAYAADEPSASGARQLAIPDGGNRTPTHPNHPANHHPHC
jgi:hypothetical protein